jgi:nucleotide-binding universal stress UspA family protein
VETIGARTAEVVVEQADAWKADVIVLGTHGRRGVTRFMLGSDAEQILRLARVPVLLVRAAEVEGGRSGKAAETAATIAARIATVAA